MYSQSVDSIQDGCMNAEFLKAIQHPFSPFWSPEKINHIDIVKTHCVSFCMAHKLS
jgi:hypothetical protein